MYSDTNDAMSFSDPTQCEKVKEEIIKLGVMRPPRAFMNSHNAIYRKSSGEVLLGPGCWLGDNYLMNGATSE